jgi:hypothetical protein
MPPLRRLGLALDSVGANQLAYLAIRLGNEALAAGELDDFTLFFNRPARPCLPPCFALLPAAELWGYPGPVVATSLDTAAQLLAVPGSQPRYFLPWDLEWLRRPRPYAELRRLYAAPELTLVARGEAHARLFRTLWGREAVSLSGPGLGGLVGRCVAPTQKN